MTIKIEATTRLRVFSTESDLRDDFVRMMQKFAKKHGLTLGASRKAADNYRFEVVFRKSKGE